MTANYVLAWLVAITALRLSWAVWRSPGHRRTSLLVVQGVILGVLGNTCKIGASFKSRKVAFR